jgi:hypothetical protein
MSLVRLRFAAAAAVLFIGACSESSGPSHGSGTAGSGGPGSGTAGTSSSGTAGSSSGTAGTSTSGTAGDGSTGTAGQSASGTAGSSSSGTAGSATSGTAGAGGTSTSGTAGAGGAGTPATAGAPGTGGTSGLAGMMGSSSECSPPPPRPINVTGTGTYNAHNLYFNKDKKPAQGKLFLLLPGIGNGPGAGGFEAFIKVYGFHVFAPNTNTNLTGSMVPQMYKDILKTDPTNHEANRQVGDARTDEWDGKGRVNWFTPPTPMVTQTVNAIKTAMQEDPGGDWGFFLNADGSLRTTDVYVVGYSWGAQTWSMISTYIRFGKVIAASGPVNEGFPNGAWMTDPSATPESCKYVLASDMQATEIFPNVIKAMWPGQMVPVHLGDPGPYTDDQHLFEMIGPGEGGTSPGGHTVFCTDSPMDKWWPVCKHVLGVPP